MSNNRRKIILKPFIKIEIILLTKNEKIKETFFNKLVHTCNLIYFCHSFPTHDFFNKIKYTTKICSKIELFDKYLTSKMAQCILYVRNIFIWFR